MIVFGQGVMSELRMEEREMTLRDKNGTTETTDFEISHCIARTRGILQGPRHPDQRLLHPFNQILQSVIRSMCAKAATVFLIMTEGSQDLMLMELQRNLIGLTVTH